MPKPTFTSVLAHLLTDAAARVAFTNDPAGFARDAGLSEADGVALAALDPRELEVQGQGLLHKRWSEVADVLPRTCAALRDSGERIFRSFAHHWWPTQHPPHVQDALAFAAFLAERQHPALDALEVNRLRFAVEQRRLAVLPLRRVVTRRGPRPALHVLCRLGRVHYEAVFFPIPALPWTG